MKPQKIKLPTARSPFSGDCTRQKQLNESVDVLLKNQPVHPPKPTVSSRASKAIEVVSTVLMFVAVIGCAYGVMAL